MAHYRKIVVNDIEYRYRVGKKTTSIYDSSKRKTTIYQNDEWGTPHIARDFSQIRVNEISGLNIEISSTPLGYIIRPGDVRGMILGEKRWNDHMCSHHPDRLITGINPDPYSAEIDRKTILIDNCPECNYESWLST